MKIEVLETFGIYFWVSKESNDASGTEFNTRDDAIADAKKRLGNVIVVNQEATNDKRKFN